MADSSYIELLNLARADLDVLCQKVDLKKVLNLPSSERTPLPIGTALWSSEYAVLLFWPSFASDPEGIINEAATAQGWFDELLSFKEKEKRKKLIDGYLVLALPAAPEGEAKEEVRKLEISSLICRKHVVWPSAAGDKRYNEQAWMRISDVTVLGLPDVTTAEVEGLYWPEIDSEAQTVWDDLMSIGVGRTIQKDERE
nr:hypothetical protein [uncultured Pseudomonas sp.]